MFGPPSSPPPAVSKDQRAALRSVLLPAFGHESPSSSTDSGVNPFKARSFLKPKFSIYRDEASNSSTANTFLPTPIPTSEANLQESSPPPSSPSHGSSYNPVGPVLAKTEPSARSALQQLIVVRVPTSGTPVTIGRSSKSSNYALSTSNRLASRVHAKLTFNPEDNLLMIECLGWNGLKVYVPRDDAIGSEKDEFPVKHQETLNIERINGITMDIHGDKALIEFLNDAHASDVTEDESWSQSDPIPSEYALYSPAKKRSRPESENDDTKENSSPNVLAEQEIPTLQPHESPQASTTKEEPPTAPIDAVPPPHIEVREESLAPSSRDVSRSTSVEPSSEGGHRKVRRQYEPLSDELKQDLMNIAANHIAFSRQSAVPFASVRKANSTLQSLPKAQVRELVRSIPCIGVIEGGVEDTTGRKAEDEYYYDIERDDNEERRNVVQSTKGHRSLRKCRKTPKQYYYRPLKNLH